jgi:hypothetical protein
MHGMPKWMPRLTAASADRLPEHIVKCYGRGRTQVCESLALLREHGNPRNNNTLTVLSEVKR